jgi:hypothetical protein
MSVGGRAALVLALLPCVLVLASCGGASTQPESPAEPATATSPESAPQVEAAAATAAEEFPSDDPSLQPQAAAGAVQGVPAPTNTAPIVAVANYFTELPGFDVAALKQRQRERFLQRVNSELCPCGCKNDTLAHCHVNDPRCPVVKGIIQKLYDEVKAGK